LLTPLSPSKTSLDSTAIFTGTHSIPSTPTPAAITPQVSISTNSPTPPHLLLPSTTPAPVMQDSWCVPWNTDSTTARVIEVIDGAHIKVLLNQKIQIVRYIGIQTHGEEFTSDAWYLSKNENEKYVNDKTVLLIMDKKDKDQENNLLRYVISDATFVNLALIENGYAIAESQPPNISCDNIFAFSEINAIHNKKGIWSPTATPTREVPTLTSTPLKSGDIIITFISYVGKGWKQPDEFVEIKNQSDQTISLENWTLRDIQDHIFYFPAYNMLPGQYCRIYTNYFSPTTCSFSFDKPSGIWSDDGECAYLYDGDGNHIHTFCYE